MRFQILKILVSLFLGKYYFQVIKFFSFSDYPTSLCTSRIMILFVMNNGRLCSKLSKIIKSKIQFLPNDIDLSSCSVIAEEQSNFILPFSPPHVQSNDWQDESFTETSSSSKKVNNCWLCVYQTSHNIKLRLWHQRIAT